MNTIIIYTILSLSVLGAIAAVVLYFVAQRFKVYEDPRIELVEAELPSANCGACGYAGCHNLAETLVKAESMDGLYCPVGGNEVMARIAAILGREATSVEPKVAVLQCNGSCEYRPQKSKYDGAKSCAIASALFSGETGCSYGCLGYGDCVSACSFGAITLNPLTGIPVIDDIKCTACGACVKSCPKKLFELRKRWKGEKKVYVACKNEDKGGVASKNCAVACIGCSKCVKTCPYEAISLNNNLAYIIAEKCRLCRKCVDVCPTHSIIETGFPVRKERTGTTDGSKIMV